MRKIKLIKRKRELIIAVAPVTPKRNRSRLKDDDLKGSSIVMISRKIDIFEDKIREKLFSEMRVFSCTVHSQKFLRSLIPSLRDKDK